MNTVLVVAMDGPSGSGKSSTARGVADTLGLRYLDTGAMYRAVTLWMLDHGVDVDDPEAVTTAVDHPVIEPGTDPLAPTITLDGLDVALDIRSQRVVAAVSAVSAVPAVRARLVERQRAVITGAGGGPGTGGIVVEGRDIGSVVAPEALVKVYLSADPAARAERRTAEQGSGDVGATEADLRRRDDVDSTRAVSPLSVAEGAVRIDTTAYTLDEVVAQVVDLVEAARSGQRG